MENDGYSDEATPDYDLDLAQISKKDWERAQAIRETIDDLLALPKQTRADVATAAGKHEISIAWMYRLIKKYKAIGKTSCLVPQKKDGGRGKGRIPKKHEQLIQAAINEHYLIKKSLKPSKVYKKYKHECKRHNLKPVAPNTFRERIRQLPARTVTKHQQGGKAARDKFDPSVGKFPRPKWPLDVVQMDHTPANIIVVDPETREPIGRASLTIAEDMYSRAVLGYVISLEAPSATTVALALAHAVVPKTAMLRDKGINAKLPMYGKMAVLHVDNGPDFWSDALNMGCLEHGIDIIYRPIKHPKFGGTVERILRTLNDELNTLDGTTKSNIFDRGEYDSDGEACLSLDELEHYLVLAIQIYHNEVHSELLMPPALAWREGIEGVDNKPGRGQPRRVHNERRFLIDFLPLIERSIQRYGFQWDYIRYYDDVLRQFIDREDKRKFIIRRDPRDISKIYFYCPDSKQYYEIPYRNMEHPTVTLHEWKAARNRLKAKGVNAEDEDLVFQSIEEANQVLQQARDKTKKARRDKARKQAAEKSRRMLPPEADHASKRTSAAPIPELDIGPAKADNFDFNATFDDIDSDFLGED